MRYLIVDDEPIAHRIIEGYCAELPYLTKVGNAYNPLEASTIVAKQSIDLIFLDLNMPKMLGFEWLKTLTTVPKVIVTTAYKEYAIEGYELDVVDYLLKPFSLARFLKAINKANSNTEQAISSLPTPPETENERLFLKGDKAHHHIHRGDILYIEAYGNYCKVHLNHKMILTHEKISNMEQLLGEEQFLRVHKSFVVAISKIDSIQGNQIYIQDHRIPVGQTYKRAVSGLVAK